MPRTIHPFPRCPKPAGESKLSKLIDYYQYAFRRRRRIRLIYNNVWCIKNRLLPNHYFLLYEYVDKKSHFFKAMDKAFNLPDFIDNGNFKMEIMTRTTKQKLDLKSCSRLSARSVPSCFLRRVEIQCTHDLVLHNQRLTI